MTQRRCPLPRQVLWPLSGLAFLMAVAPAGAAVPGPPAAEPAAVRGRVVDPEGRPVAGVEVWPLRGFPRQPAAVTGEDGSFALGGLPAGTLLDLSLCRRGFTEREMTVSSPPGGAGAPFLAVLEPASRMTGQVVDAEGRPVPGAAVSYARFYEPGSRTDLWDGTIASTISPFRYPRSSSCGRFGFNARTDREGRFDFEPVTPGRYRLRAAEDGFTPAVPAVVLAEAGREAEVRLVLARAETGAATDPWQEMPHFSEPPPASPPELLVRGRVVLPRGVPRGARAARAKIEAWLGSADLYASTVAAADGSFSLRLPAGFYDLWASAGRWSGGKERVLVAEPLLAPLEEIEIHLAEGGSLAGRITGLAPAERGAVTVAAYRPENGAPGDDGSPGSLPAVHLDAAGRYRLPHAPPGSWIVEAAMPTGLRAARNVEVEPGRPTVADLALPPARWLRGRVVDESGAPLALARVRLLREELPSIDIPTAGDGSFALRLPDGRYQVEVARPDYYPAGPTEITLAGELREDLEIQLVRGGVISGRRLAAHDDAIGGQVTAEGPGGKVEVQPGPDGRYRLTGLAPGEWTVSSGTQEGGRRGYSLTVRLTLPPPAPGLPPAELQQDFDLGPGDVALTVEIPQGEPRPGLLRYELSSLDTAAGERKLGNVSDSSLVDFDRLLPGCYQLRVWRLTGSAPFFDREIEILTSQTVRIDP